MSAYCMQSARRTVGCFYHQRRRALHLAPLTLTRFHRQRRRLTCSLSLSAPVPQQRRGFHQSSPVNDTPAISDASPTIYALSTAAGRAAIAIVRVSGPACSQIYASLCPNRPLPKPRAATMRPLHDPSHPSTILDPGALILHFPAPHSVTGEDVLELHIHGGPAITKAVLAAIPRCCQQQQQQHQQQQQFSSTPHLVAAKPSIRPAEPGEFTRRAFWNDRLSLPHIEALGSVLAAETEQQRVLAVRGAGAGGDALAARYEEWRRALLLARGHLEALIDFAEDQDFGEAAGELVGVVGAQVRGLKRRIGLYVENAARGEMMRGGVRVALVGAPNAGKSSLLNCVVGREAAIVSTEQGTTRDIVDVGVDVAGWFVRLGDMAGLRSEASSSSSIANPENMPTSIGAIEKEGIRRAKARALESDVIVAVLAYETDPESGKTELNLEPEVVEAVRDCIARGGKNVVVAVNKTDQVDVALTRDYAGVVEKAFGVARDQVFMISCKRATEIETDTDSALRADDPGGIQSFLRGLTRVFMAMTTVLGDDEAGAVQDRSSFEDALAVTHRQSENLKECAFHLENYLLATNDAGDAGTEIDVVMAAEHLRFAADALARNTGRAEAADVEDVLGVVFEKYSP